MAIGLPVVSPVPSHLKDTASCGAQYTSSPTACGHSETLASSPVHAISENPGASQPLVQPWCPAAATPPEKPICLQATEAAPWLKPSEQTPAQAPPWKTSKRPLPPGLGAPSAESKRAEPSPYMGEADVRVQKMTESCTCVWHASSAAAQLHSESSISPPVQVKFCIDTGDPSSPHRSTPPYTAQGLEPTVPWS